MIMEQGPMTWWQDRELDLKKGAELLGVSYSTLYGRYRESHGYLRHAWTRVRDRPGGEWWDADQQDAVAASQGPSRLT